MSNLVLKDKLIPGAGYYTVEVTPEDDSQDTIIYKTDKEEPFSKGTIVKAGDRLITKDGAVIFPQYKPGDNVLLSYSSYEKITEGTESVYLIGFHKVVAKYNG